MEYNKYSARYNLPLTELKKYDIMKNAKQICFVNNKKKDKK